MVANMKVVSVPFGTREHELSLETTGSPTFHPSRPTKIIISPGHNGGWVSHAPPEAPDAFLAWMITYEPLIEALEKRYTREPVEDIVARFHHEAKVKFGLECKFVSRGGADLVVLEVAFPFEIHEYDGVEKIVNVSSRRVVHL